MAKRKTRGLYHGYLVVDKPAGMTSHDVVGCIRRLLNERRVGHAGTLDPAATGVLPIAVGMATRSVEYLSDASKGYLAEFTLGVTTDSADIDGTVTDIRDASKVLEQDLRTILREFIGSQMQVPPMHSAIKVGGQRMYELARKGESIELEARPITIHEIELLSWSAPVAEVYVHCSKGTYIRSLARDIGERAGTGAYMSNLVRVHTGPFTLDDAWTLGELELALQQDRWEETACHPDASLQDRPAIILDEELATSWKHGNPVPAVDASGIVRVYDWAGNWLGVGTAEAGKCIVRPSKVVLEA